MKVIIDRFENGFAVVELQSKEFENIPTVLVPDAKEGDVIDISIDNDTTLEREVRINALMGQVFGDNGDNSGI